ncbi:MAG: FG-GAP repeat domain-containing protein, partial [Microcystaceae cyanobacterium]
MSTDFSKRPPVNENFSEPTGLAFLDLDNDKLSDLVAVSSGFAEDDLLWHKNTGSGFDTKANTVYGELGGGRNAFYGADIDNDKDIDLVSAESGTDDIKIWYNLEKGTKWTATNDKNLNLNGDFNGATKLFVADFGTDGWLDIVGVADEDDDVSIWRQTSKGVFQSELYIDNNLDGARAVYAGDF